MKAESDQKENTNVEDVGRFVQNDLLLWTDAKSSMVTASCGKDATATVGVETAGISTFGLFFLNDQ